MKDFLKKLSKNIDNKTVVENFSKIAVVTDVLTGGYFNVETSAGIPITTIVSLGGSFKFKEGQWVTIEKFGGDWAIVGIAAQKGGD